MPGLGNVSTSRALGFQSGELLGLQWTGEESAVTRGGIARVASGPGWDCR